MSIFSTVGHFLGNIFGGDDEKKRKQQEQSASLNSPSVNRQQTSFEPQQGPTSGRPLYSLPQSSQPLQQNAPDNGVKLNLLQKTTPTVTTTTTAAPNPKPNLLQKVGGAVAGTALAATRMGTGLVEGALDTPSIVAHTGVYLGRKLTGSQTAGGSITDAVDKATNVVTAPIKAVDRNLDAAALAYGPGSQAVYKPAQVVENAAAVVPAVAAGGAALLQKANKAPAVIDALKAVAAQGERPTLNMQLLQKAKPSLAPDEGAPGLRSTNPNREVDAAAQNAQQVPQEQQLAQAQAAAGDLNTPAYQRRPAKAQANTLQQQIIDQKAVEAGAGPAPTDAPAFQHKQDIQAVISQGEQELNDWAGQNPAHSIQQLEEAKSSIQSQVAERIAQLQHERYNTPPVDVPAAPLQTQGVASTLSQEAVPPQPAPVAAPPVGPAVPTPSVPAEVAPAVPVTSAPASITPGVPVDSAPGGLPQLAKGGDVAEAAPNTHDAIVNRLGASQLKGNYATRDVVHIDELKRQAAHSISDIPDQQLADAFAGANPDTLVHDPQTFAVARASLDRLYAMKDNPLAEQQVSNILDAMSRWTSKNAQGLRVVQEEFDNMPLPMKVRYLIRKIDAANVKTKGYEPLARDPAKAAEVEAVMSARLQASQDIAERVSMLKAQADEAAAKAESGELVNFDVKGVRKQIQQESTNLKAANGEVAKYFQSLVPGRSALQRGLVDFPKRMMLSGFTGRVNDLLTTSATVGHLQAQNVTQGIIGGAYNLVKGPGAVTNTLKGGSRLVSSIGTGLKKFSGEVGGKQYVDNLEKTIRGHSDLRSGLPQAKGVVSRTIQGVVELPTHLTEGVADQRLVQLADQEAAQKGLKGALRKQYVEARSAAPSRQMQEAASRLHEEVNNLNDNPISRWLGNVAAGIDNGTPIGGVLKNQILPFTKWVSGNIWNSVFDRNVIAKTFKFARDAAVRKDPEGAIKNLAGAINGAAEAYAVGYTLSKTGVVTDKNAEGYNDAGLYFHLGDRYVSVGALGSWAPNIVLGHAAFQGLNAPGSPAENIGKVVGNFAWNGLGLNQALGAENNLNRAINAGTQPGGSFADGAAVGGGNVAGQFVPALGGDINSVLNNGLKVAGKTLVPDSLDPTHEAANTRVQNTGLTKTGRPSKAKDPVASAWATLLNKVPLVSQQLPRKTGVAAPDLVDRTVHGDRSTQTQKDNAAKAQAVVDQTADLKKRDIPNFKDKGFDDAVEARVQRGEYDKAIEALQVKLNDQSNNKDIPGTKNKKLEDDIKGLQVLKNGKFEPGVRDLYKSTSPTEWRNMGDPKSDTYDPETYQKLYDYDKALADAGISGSTLAKDKNKYTAKKSGTGYSSGYRRSSSYYSSSDYQALQTAKSNTIGSLPTLQKVSLSDLKPEKAGSLQMPTIKPQIASSDLIKKRKIVVSKA